MKYDICMVVGGLSFNADSIKTGALGGSETAAVYMARELAKLGNYVKVFCDCGQVGVFDGVQYIPISMANEFAQNVPHDVLIVQRDPGFLAAPFNSKINILWNHDLAMGRNEAAYKSILWNTDKFLVLSDYHKKQYMNTLHLDEKIFHQTRNGIDLDLINSIDQPTRTLRNLVYGARPERGLDILLSQVMPKLLDIDPEYKLFIAGYDNPRSELGEFYAHCNQLADRLGRSVIRVGGLAKADLYKLYKSCGAYVYPSPSPINKNFNEISCISAMESMACGLPFIGSNRGALSETLAPEACKLIDGDVTSHKFINDFVDAIVTATSDSEINQHMSTAGTEHAKNLDWSGIAREWVDMFDGIITEKNNSPERLARHFYKMSDLIMSKRVAKSDNLSDISKKINEDIAFLETPESFAKQYEDGDEANIYTVEHTKSIAGTPRYERLREYIAQNKNRIKTVIDYGCSGGGFATNLANDFQDIEFFGVDINDKVLTEARKNAEVICELNRPSFHNLKVAGSLPRADLVICQEVLEHVEKPWNLINSVEELGSSNALMYYTVPYGPWESDSFTSSKYRYHVWHFDQHDISDMVGAKLDFTINAIPAGRTQRYSMPCGWWQFSYQKSYSELTMSLTREIDLKRKERLQAPMQTVSAVLMAGQNVEEQLRWCLNSIASNIDELIIVDNGMSTAALEIASQYNAKIVPGCDPKIYGFETPRNIGVNAATMDFILWIDTDEKLLNPSNITKYLRTNYFDGYAVRQHHFACDAQLPPDTPVRIFRNNRGIRFFGMIHEHPEKAVNEGPGDVIVLSDLDIAHTGYLNENVRRGRFVRNYPMLIEDCKKYPDRLLQKHFIMRDNMLLVQYELQQNGGRITPQIVERCELVVHTYKSTAEQSKKLAHVDSLQWYTQALQILNRGINIDCKLSINGENVGFNGRFESIEQVNSEISTILESTGGKYLAEYY